MKPPRKPSNPIKRSVIERLMVYFQPAAPPPPPVVEDDAPTIRERPANFFPPPRPFTAAGPLPPQAARIPEPAPRVDPNAPPLYPLNSSERRRPD